MQSSTRGLVGEVSVQVSPGGGNKVSLVGTDEDWGIAAARASTAVHSWSISNCFAMASKNIKGCVRTLGQDEEPTDESEE